MLLQLHLFYSYCRVPNFKIENPKDLQKWYCANSQRSNSKSNPNQHSDAFHFETTFCVLRIASVAVALPLSVLLRENEKQKSLIDALPNRSELVMRNVFFVFKNVVHSQCLKLNDA